MRPAPPNCVRACSKWRGRRLQRAFALLDRKATVDLLGPQEVELWRGRIRTRAWKPTRSAACRCGRYQHATDANWTAGLSAFVSGNMAEPRGAFEMVADAAPDQARLDAGGRLLWAARATCWPAIRRNSRPI